jgi:hypothetical protein
MEAIVIGLQLPKSDGSFAAFGIMKTRFRRHEPGYPPVVSRRLNNFAMMDVALAFTMLALVIPSGSGEDDGLIRRIRRSISPGEMDWSTSLRGVLEPSNTEVELVCPTSPHNLE